MNKLTRSLVSLVLLLSLLLTLPSGVFAEEAPEEPQKQELHIRSLEDFLQFSRRCVRDKYSENLTVYLDTNLDLTGTDFSGIPIFTGIFEGNHHSITGLELTTEGSNQGLCRYLTRDGVIRNLNLEATVLPEGSQNAIGGLVGTSWGTVSGCRFTGQVAGCDSVGGLVGINQVSGIIENCQTSGNIRGAHFAGGIAGENLGVIRFCKNMAHINVTEEDNNIDRVELTPEFIMGKESAETVTDLGGIAGTSTGVIRDCSNLGTVGYPHMGYNIGGIAGSQKGYITDCQNHGPVSGRKEVGGIAGQLEPTAKITYSADTLQILREQLDTTSRLADRAASHVRGGAQDIGQDIQNLHGQVGVAMDAVHELLFGGIPDIDSIIAAGSALSGSISSIQNITASLNGSIQATVSSAAGDVHAITRQVSAMSQTLDNAAENLGGTITDVSDQDTADDLSAKISDCENHREILGDLNVGGIAGAIAWENDKDPEGDFEVTGEQSLNFDSIMRAVVLDCRNTAAVTAKKRYAGGITGNMTMGLVKGCTNTGFLEGEGADYQGGIAGVSYGFIRSCSSKTRITGKSYLGGIAGQAPVVTDCRSIVQILDGTEKLGSILGLDGENRSETEAPISDNYYLPLPQQLGAIDGIDYYSHADSLTKQEFLALPELDPVFRQATMVFRFPDDTTKNLVVPLGQVVTQDKIPELPQKEGYMASWKHLDEVDLSNVFLDGTLEAEYTPCYRVAQSQDKRPDGKPILLAEGQFGSTQEFSLTPADSLPGKAPEGWSLQPLTEDAALTLHLSVPEGLKPRSSEVLVQKADGSWEVRKSMHDGSYLVFDTEPGDQTVAVRRSTAMAKKLSLILGGCALVVILLLIFFLRRRKKRQASSKKA